jgi:type VI secretion system protein ImpJ
MTRTHRILWGEGLFLRPQHFQQQDLYLEDRLRQCLASAQGHPWGVRQVRLDAAALAAGLVAFERIQVTFQDGTRYDAPDQEELPPARALDRLPNLAGAPLVSACLPLWDPAGSNAGNRESTAAAPLRPQRYRPVQVPARDLHTDALECELAVLQPNVRLLLEGEDRDGQLAVPLVRLSREGAGSWAADPGFLPPLLALTGAPALQARLRALAELLLARSRTLAGARREGRAGLADPGALDGAPFALLRSVNRSCPALDHLLAQPGSHPEAAYLVLAQLAGELLAFATEPGLEAIPPYHHDRLEATFPPLERLLRELLDTVVPSRCAAIPLREARPGLLIGQLDHGPLAGSCDFYLLAAADRPGRQIAESVPLGVKVGAPEEVDRLVQAALPGVVLAHLERPPAALPARLGRHCFALEPTGPIYQRMLQCRSIAVHLPAALAPMELELVAVAR